MKRTVTPLLLFLFISKGFLNGQTADFSADTLIGCKSLEVQFTDLSTDATSWQWDFDGDGTFDSQEKDPIYTYNSGGQYSVSLRINNSVTHTKKNYITVVAIDSVFWFRDTLAIGSYNYIFRNAVQIGEPIITYRRNWSFSDQTTAFGRRVVHQFPDTGKYKIALEITPLQLPQCNASFSRRIRVRNSINIPNVFSPNGDDINDYFIIDYNGVTPLHFNLYSRYGNLIYKSNAPIVAWDGKNLSGQDVSPGVYYFVVTSDDGEISKTGFLHLYR